MMLKFENEKNNRFFFSPIKKGTILAGSLSSMRNESNQLYSRLETKSTNWIKFDNCGNPILEKPTKTLEVFKLFLLGLGYTLKNTKRLSQQLTIKKSASTPLNPTAINQQLNEPNSCLIDFFTPN